MVGQREHEAHRLTVERRGPQRFVAVCSCGWEGLNKKGTEYWQKAGALSGCLGHLTDHGLTMIDLPAVVDLDPSSRRGAKP